MEAHPCGEIFPTLGRQTRCSRLLSSVWLNERLKVAASLSRLWFMLLCSLGIWTVALWRQTSIILMSSTYCCCLRFPWCHCRGHTKHILLLHHRFFSPPPSLVMHPFFNKPDLFFALQRQSGNDTQTGPQGKRSLNIHSLGSKSLKGDKNSSQCTWLSLKQCSAF